MKSEQKLAQRFQRRSRLKMLTDGHGRTYGRMTDEKVITTAHPEQSSGELTTTTKKKKTTRGPRATGRSPE